MATYKRIPHLLLMIPLAIGFSSSDAAGSAVTEATVRFKPETSPPKLVITLSTNPIHLIPKPATMDMDAIALYRMEALTYANWPDPDIEITMRLVDYTATSVSDAIIKKGAGVSFDTGVYSLSNKIEHNGSVTITEFTEDVITGRFDAEFFTVGLPKQPIPAGRASGWFVISNPVLNDPRIPEEFSDSELIRANLTAMWDTLRNTGLSLGQAEQLSRGSGSGNGGGTSRPLPGGAGGVDVFACICECDVLVTLPPDHLCIQADGPCYEGLKICNQHGLGHLTKPAVSDIDEILDIMFGADAPGETRAMMRQTLEDMSPKERTQMLEIYRLADEKKTKQ